ncbi:MAG: serine/threonine protein kinase [Phycisphaerales bacterium]|nr:MAG: serine/threonine protein kinase [Phycisphaerales bacterium]
MNDGSLSKQTTKSGHPQPGRTAPEALTPPRGLSSLRGSALRTNGSAPHAMTPPSNTPDPGDSDKLRMPDDEPRRAGTATSGGTSGAGMPSPVSGGSKAGSKAARTTQDTDTILARLVVEQGFATMEEVQECIRKQRDAAEPGGSLAQLLVNSDFITKRQLDRLRAQVEAERSGQHIPGYTILGKLGAGAMATVFKARQMSLDRLVAIKILPRKYSSDPQFIERFNAEGRSAAQLNHPNIVQAYDVGKAGEFHYFVMEYVEGSSVYEEIVRKKRYTEKEAVETIIQVAEALDHAHTKGLIHRDVKPKNIMISKEGVVKLADMGLARAITDREAAEAEAGKAFGTPYYISPEQVRGEVDVGPQADIYALGCTLYHMVTGKVPFEGKDPSEVMRKHLKTPPVAPDAINAKLTSGVCEVIEKMMAKRRADRYQNCADMLSDLHSVLKGETPAIAHKPIAGAAQEAISEVLMEVESRPAEIAIDKTRAPSPFSHVAVQFVVIMLIISVILNFVLLVL